MKGLCELSNETWDKAQCFQDCFPYVEIGAINCENGEIGGIEELVTAEAPSRAQMVVRAGDLLVSATRPTRNAIAIVPLDVEKAIASTGFLVVRGVQSTLVTPKYLFHALRMEFCTKQFDQYSSGGNYPAITKEDFRKIIIPLPSLSEQRKIVAELDAAYAAKRVADEKATNLLASIDEMVLKELGIANLPKPDTSLSSRIFTVSAKEVANATLAPDHYFDSIDFSKAKYPCERFVARIDIDPSCGFERITKLVPMEGVSAEWCAIERIEDISPDATQGYSAFCGSDVIWARITPCMENGKSAVVEAEPSECFCGSTEFLVFRPKDDKVNPCYLQSLLHLKRFREVAAHHFTGTSGHQRVTADFFKAISIPIPPRSVQDRIASTASSIRAEARKLKADATAALDTAKRKIEEKIMK
jgi:type I restriction enzyme S subunit